MRIVKIGQFDVKLRAFENLDKLAKMIKLYVDSEKIAHFWLFFAIFRQVRNNFLWISTAYTFLFCNPILI